MPVVLSSAWPVANNTGDWRRAGWTGRGAEAEVMATELTPAVGRAVEAAQRHARADNAESVTPLHLLAGLLEEDEGSAASLVIDAGLDLGAFRTAWPPAGEVSSLP